ncbi:MAG TPA: tRNA lysidine(34) synthetase TilS [Actinomycetes bacterium]|nr:tRNA lysidine(34) synthetase TilS [Actinomycetes bacterium]
MTRAPAELRLVADLAAKALAAAGAPATGDGVAVAVSGGADSLALLHALRTLAGPRGWRLAVLTVDHGLRPGSAADAAFVADHAKALGLPTRVLTLTAGDLDPHRPAGPEAAARAARYAALWPAAGELGCDWLATGHTLDDQAETVLLQLLRGAGPDGLAGMTVRTGRLLRPLLGVRRADTHAACTAVGLTWREDPTNAEDSPLRNRVRSQLLPLLEELRPGATRTLARTATLAADERDWLGPLAAATLAATTHTVRPGPQPGDGEKRRDMDGGSGGEREGGVDGGDPPIPPWATRPVGALQSLGLDAEALAALPVALGRRVVRAAARRAGVAVPDAAATDRVLALTAAADGDGTGWPGGSARREGRVVRLGPPPGLTLD